MIYAVVALLLFLVARTQHLLMRDGVHNIFSREMTYITITHERWSPQHLFLVDGLHIIYSCDMESTAFTDEILSTQYLILRDGVHSIYS